MLKTFVYLNLCVYFVFLFRSFFGNLNFFGGPSCTSVKGSAKLQQIEEENQDAMFIVLSDIWLDQIKVSLYQ